MLALKAVLQNAGISQAGLARDCEVSPATIAEIVNHGRWPKNPTQYYLQSVICLKLSANAVQFDKQTLFKPISTASTAETDKQELTHEVIDMLLRKHTLSLEAKKAFGLFRDPFSDDLNDAEDVFAGSPNICNVREHLWQTAKSGGFIAIHGESGSGKTTLRLDLLDRIRREDAPIIIIEPYVLGMEDNDVKGKTLKSASIIDAIIRKVAPNEKPFSSMEAKSRQLHRILQDSRRSGYTHCVIIEEAHALSTPTLKHLKRFMELQDGFKKLLSIVLIGQSELKTKLNAHSPEIREVVQRCELIELPPLDAFLESYLRFKFARVGSDIANVLAPDACDGVRGRLIFAKSAKGAHDTVSLMYPLMVNNLITTAMNQAALLGFDKVSRDLILEA